MPWAICIFFRYSLQRGGHTEKKRWNSPSGPDVFYSIHPEWYFILRIIINQLLLPRSEHVTNYYEFKSLTFTSHHWTRLKSFLTGAFKPSNHILASSISTRIAHRTFINICRWPGEYSKHNEWEKTGLDSDNTFYSIRILWSVMSYFIRILSLQRRNAPVLLPQVCRCKIQLAKWQWQWQWQWQ